MQCGDDRVHGLGGGVLIGPDVNVVVQAVPMAQFVAASRQPGGSAFNTAVGPAGFAPLQLRHRAENSHQQGSPPAQDSVMLCAITIPSSVLPGTIFARSEIRQKAATTLSPYL